MNDYKLFPLLSGIINVRKFLVFSMDRLPGDLLFMHLLTKCFFYSM
jgi:hypothetical protein